MTRVGELMNIETEFWRPEGVGEIYERLMTDDGRCVLRIGILVGRLDGPDGGILLGSRWTR